MAYVSQHKENSRAQHQPDSIKAVTQTFFDSREPTTATLPLQTMMANSPQQQKLKAIAQMMANSPVQQRLNTSAQTTASKSQPLQQMEDEEPLQGKFESEPGQLETAAEAPRPNNTGSHNRLTSLPSDLPVVLRIGPQASSWIARLRGCAVPALHGMCRSPSRSRNATM